MIDPIGTVRRHSFTGGFELWAVVAERRGTTDGEDAFWPVWQCIWANDPAFVGSDLPPKEIDECAMVGAIPGTPAAEERPVSGEATSPSAAVREFHEAFGLPINDTTRTLNKLRADLIREEARETADAIENEGPEAWAKELADLAIVTYGAALTLGVDLDHAVRLVHDSNMSKLGSDGKPVMREDGKVLKGPNYRPPDMTTVIPRTQEENR